MTTFPTRQTPNHKGYIPPPGTPSRAQACRCDHPFIDRATSQCLRCGHYPTPVIAKTWHDRARQVASQ